MKQELPTCPVEITMELIGNKWKILIIRDLLTGTKRFGELRKSLNGISQKILWFNGGIIIAKCKNNSKTAIL